jgi:hypothetical protein
MSLLEDAMKGLGGGTGLAIGLGVVLLAPGLLPAVARAVRPLAVGAIRMGMEAYGEASASMRDAMGDIMAEARAGMEDGGARTGSDTVAEGMARSGRRGREAEAT